MVFVVGIFAVRNYGLNLEDVMSVEFEKLTAGKLNPGAIVPQGLDNQWAPSNALRRLIKQAKS